MLRVLKFHVTVDNPHKVCRDVDRNQEPGKIPICDDSFSAKKITL